MKEEVNSHIPASDLPVPETLATATLAMGCFWSPDALFGSHEGVWRTRVGYAGGSTEAPTYRNLADHIETVQLDFDPARLSYRQLLDIFFGHHKPIGEPWKRQYMSAIFFHNEEQRATAEEAIEAAAARLDRKIYTAVYPYEIFYLAEDRHQKYKLQRQPAILTDFRKMYPAFPNLVNSTAAARINGLLYGYGKADTIKPGLSSFGLSAEGLQALLENAKSPQGIHC
jgi:peptide-methionine (S)-S-oxide reductase